MYSTSASARWYFGESSRSGGPGSNWSLRFSRNGRALPCPARIAGLETGGVSWKTPGAGGGGVQGMSTEAVSRPSPARSARMTDASCAPAAIPLFLGRTVGHRREPSGQARVEARLLAGDLGGQGVVQSLREGGHRVVTVILPAKCSRGGQPAHRPRAALRDRLGEVRGVDRLAGDVVPGQADG
jgi:hypothetical protein